jgi:hypothetical protein
MMNTISRRSLFQAAAGIAVGRAAQPSIAEVVPELDKVHKWNDSNGDTWDPFWADDDNLYAFHCDGRGFGKQSRNLGFDRLSGPDPLQLAGSLVNPMDAYGEVGKKERDGATWKACGQESIDSVFYAFVSRNVYGKDSGDSWLRQTAFNSSLIKSTDRGVTWTRGAAENYSDPMWPGPAFGSPFFVHYGKNGGDVAQDDARLYVYAISNNGFWNDGDQYIAGRVPRAKLPEMRAADWTYFAGPGRWSPRIREAAPILSLPRRCGQTGPCYIPALGLYLLVVWYNTEKMIKWFEPNEMRYEFYQAPHPWGPWTAINGFSDRFLATGHMYGPSLCAKFQRREGPDVKMTLFTAGCPFEDQPSGLYKAWAIPLILKTVPQPPSKVVPATSADYAFSGTGVDYITDKDKGAGSVAVYVDGKLAETVSLAVDNFPKLRGVTVFRARWPRPGRHSIRIARQPSAADAFRVYGG